MKTLTVRASRAYDITIGRGARSLLPRAIAAAGARAVHVVTDENVSAAAGDAVLSVLDAAGIPRSMTVLPPGEEHKTLGTVARLYSDLAANSITRADLIIALGGGVVGDIAGFAAATYMRGIQYIQMPTTLIALTDSSVGGKTGVNLPEGKNLAGAFWQPSAVLADTEFLAALPEREYRAGMAEVVKYYALGAAGLAELIPNGPIDEIARLCCWLKVKIVETDERDTGDRMALNLGHTVGHAIEKYFGYSRYNHGEAVALGLRIELAVGAALGVTPQAVYDDVMRVASLAGLDTALDIEPAALVPHMLSDKKNTRGKIAMILLRALGEPEVHEMAPDDLLKGLKNI